MSTMTVSELAKRTGLTASALRYYESLGLLRSHRRENGYRSYGEDAVERLRFVRAARGLDLDLASIADLMPAWESRPCAQVKDELRPLLERRLDAAVRARTAGDVMVRDLRASLRHLDELPDRAERCAPECAFLGEADRRLNQIPATDDVPVACRLDGRDQGEQVGRWRTVLAGAPVVWTSTGAVITVPVDRVGEVAELAADEVACCPFLTFTLRLTPGDAELEVVAPAEGRGLLEDMLGACAEGVGA